MSPIASSLKKIEALHEDYKIALPACAEDDAFLSMLRLFACKYSTRDIVEEYCMLGVWPDRGGWSIPDSDETDTEGPIPCPHWTKYFEFTKESKILRLPSLILILLHISSSFT